MKWLVVCTVSYIVDHDWSDIIMLNLSESACGELNDLVSYCSDLTGKKKQEKRHNCMGIVWKRYHPKI